MREQKTTAQVRKTTTRSYPPPPIPSPIIYKNNTMDIEFLVQIRESNKCGSVRNDEIFNLHLGSGVSP